jgi:hypothetical protein
MRIRRFYATLATCLMFLSSLLLSDAAVAQSSSETGTALTGEQVSDYCHALVVAFAAASSNEGFVCVDGAGLVPQTPAQLATIERAGLPVAGLPFEDGSVSPVPSPIPSDPETEGTPSRTHRVHSQTPRGIIDSHHWDKTPPVSYYGIGTQVIGSVQEYYSVELSFSTSDVDVQQLTWLSGPKLKRYVYHRIWNNSSNQLVFADNAQQGSYTYGTWGKYDWDIISYFLSGNTYHYHLRTSIWSQGYTNPSEPTGRFFAPAVDSAPYVCGSQYGCEF